MAVIMQYLQHNRAAKLGTACGNFVKCHPVCCNNVTIEVTLCIKVQRLCHKTTAYVTLVVFRRNTLVQAKKGCWLNQPGRFFQRFPDSALQQGFTWFQMPGRLIKDMLAVHYLFDHQKSSLCRRSISELLNSGNRLLFNHNGYCCMGIPSHRCSDSQGFMVSQRGDNTRSGFAIHCGWQV
jgi:hypothetical protein